MRYLLFAFYLLISITSTHAQLVGVSGTINTYVQVTSIDPSCDNIISVANASGFNAGDVVLIIQMQGATTDLSNTASFGSISSYNNAGLFEKATIGGIAGSTIYFTHDLVNNYDINGKVQMISIPQYVNVATGGTLTCADWNGTTGGVLVLEASGYFHLAGGPINVDGRGFSGAANTQGCPNACGWAQNNNAYYYAAGNYRGALKGDGIAPMTTGYEVGRGALANGGGGGNDHNAGGGGGGNYGSGGQGSRNNEPGFFNCKGPNPGIGGRGLAAAYNGAAPRLFLGGGGGAGHGNNNNVAGCDGGGNSSPGGDGGGIVIIIAQEYRQNAGRFISANGNNASIGNFDGAGGGGAGGVVFLDIQTYTNAPTIQAIGGNGGNTACGNQNRCYGPGGGGAGGVVIGSNPIPGTKTLAGGSPGIVTGSSNGCNNTSIDAASGANGDIIIGSYIPVGTSLAPSNCVLPVEYTSFDAMQEGNRVRLDWQTEWEINNSHFVIERSANAIDYLPLGEVAGYGTTSSAQRYHYFDYTPLNGKSWYRLKQVDIDGKFSFSAIREVYFDAAARTIQGVRPNPTTSSKGVTVDLNLAEPGYLKIEVVDAMGRIVKQQEENVNPGLVPYQIDLQNLQAGIYFLKVNVNGQREVYRISLVR